MPGGLTQEEAAAADVAYEQDLERARELLAEAGHPDGFSIDLITSEMAAYRANYEVLQAELAEIGITVNLNVVDHATMHEQIREDVNPIVIYVAYRPNADVYLTNFFHSDSIVVDGESPITNFSHYAEIDDLIEQARAETDPAAQEELWKQANIQILEDMAAFPLHYQNQVYARTPAVDYGHELVSSLALYPQITELTTVER
jgi:peptide/nickel transport system substrate-binding protein